MAREARNGKMRTIHGGRVLGACSGRRIWLASYPRSGNTLLRCILHGCFGLPSTSIYGSDDLGGNALLERYAGHFDAAAPPPWLTSHMPWLVKTHHRPQDTAPAIYVVRDPRAATVSLWEFNHRRKPQRAIISGDTAWGTWSSHVAAWKPQVRPNTLMLRYEEMVNDLPTVLQQLSGFLGLPVLSRDAPPRVEIAAIDGRWVREPSDWRTKITARDLRLLEEVNGEMLAMLGYNGSGAGPPTGNGPMARLGTSWVVAYSSLRGRVVAYLGLRGRVRRHVARFLLRLRP